MKNNVLSQFSGMFSSILSGGEQGEIVNRTLKMDGENFIYQLYLPPQITNKVENPPLLIFLHGIRERGTDGFVSGMFATVVKQYLKQIPAIILLPQCRPNKFWSDPQMDKMVVKQIEEVRREFSVDAKRKYLLGVSMGGYGVWHFAAEYSNDFAALVSICGGSPILNGDRFSPIAEKIGKTPAWLFHGAEDKVVQVSESRNMAAAIRENNGEVKYTEYPNASHNVWLNALGEKDLLPWLLSQKSEG